jgi:DNA invertase Pin-like site-specific DNA recombinase
MPTAYSYLRFSSPQQATGDSIRRQTTARDKWLAEHPDAHLDTSLVMTDAGRSGYKRKDWDAYALAAFVEAIKSGRVAKGSYLLVENLDRLSRENAGDATELFLSIVNRGIVIVQLSPVVMEFKKPVDMTSLMFAIVELSRGYSESAIKSERSRASWGRKQREAGRRLVTRRLPGWISCRDGKLMLNEHAPTVRRMFAMARDGLGTPAIALRLNEEKLPTLGRKTFRGRPVKWSGANVWHILTSTAAIGEYVPYRRRGTRALPGVSNYYPAVVDAATFSEVQAAITTRGRVGRGRKGKYVNLFSGLLRDARDGGSLTYWTNGGHPAVLIPVNAKEGKGTAWASFPAAMFDDAVLALMHEVSEKDVAGEKAESKVDVLRVQRDELDALIEKWLAQMDNPAIVDTVAAKLAELNVKRRAVERELEEAEYEDSVPMAEAWRECRTLADVLRDDNSIEMRTKVRAALRRCIESVTCLIVALKGTRTKVAAVRVQFRSGVHREYLITARSVCGNRREASWAAESFADAGLPNADLREPKQASKLEVLLTKHAAKK